MRKNRLRRGKRGKKHKRRFSFSLFQKDPVKNFLGSSQKIKVIVSSSFYVCYSSFRLQIKNRGTFLSLIFKIKMGKWKIKVKMSAFWRYPTSLPLLKSVGIKWILSPYWRLREIHCKTSFSDKHMVCSKW